MRWMIAALFVAGMISSATAEDTAQKAYEAVAFHLTLARSCSPEAYERAKAGTQETLDAGNYTERTAEEIFMLVEALETEPFPEAFCKDMLASIEGNTEKLNAKESSRGFPRRLTTSAPTAI